MNENKFKTIQAYVNETQFEQLKDESKESGISISALIKLMIRDRYNHRVMEKK